MKMKEGPLVPKTHDPGIVFLAIIVQEFGSPHETLLINTYNFYFVIGMH